MKIVKWFKKALHEYYCFSRGIPVDFKEVTGWNTIEEWNAYEKGREHEQNTIIKWIENWDGSTTSHMGQLLHDKFNKSE